jgi:hypothetical protein
MMVTTSVSAVATSAQVAHLGQITRFGSCRSTMPRLSGPSRARSTSASPSRARCHPFDGAIPINADDDEPVQKIFLRGCWRAKHSTAARSITSQTLAEHCFKSRAIGPAEQKFLAILERDVKFSV